MNAGTLLAIVATTIGLTFMAGREQGLREAPKLELAENEFICTLEMPEAPPPVPRPKPKAEGRIITVADLKELTWII